MPTQIQKQIEEAMDRLEQKLKPLYKSGSLDVFDLKIAIEKELSTIATKSAEEAKLEAFNEIVTLRSGYAYDNYSSLNQQSGEIWIGYAEVESKFLNEKIEALSKKEQQ